MLEVENYWKESLLTWSTKLLPWAHPYSTMSNAMIQYVDFPNLNFFCKLKLFLQYNNRFFGIYSNPHPFTWISVCFLLLLKCCHQVSYTSQWKDFHMETRPTTVLSIWAFQFGPLNASIYRDFQVSMTLFWLSMHMYVRDTRGYCWGATTRGAPPHGLKDFACSPILSFLDIDDTQKNNGNVFTPIVRLPFQIESMNSGYVPSIKTHVHKLDLAIENPTSTYDDVTPISGPSINRGLLSKETKSKHGVHHPVSLIIWGLVSTFV